MRDRIFRRDFWIEVRADAMRWAWSEMWNLIFDWLFRRELEKYLEQGTYTEDLIRTLDSRRGHDVYWYFATWGMNPLVIMVILYWVREVWGDAHVWGDEV